MDALQNQALRTFAETGEYSFSGVPGDRLRGRISKAGSQLRARARPDQPTLVVVYNNVDVLRGYTGPHAVMSAMYGLYQAVITTSRGLGARIVSVAHRLGGGRSMTPLHNTTISGLAVLFDGPEALTLLSITIGSLRCRFGQRCSDGRGFTSAASRKQTTTGFPSGASCSDGLPNILLQQIRGSRSSPSGCSARALARPDHLENRMTTPWPLAPDPGCLPTLPPPGAGETLRLSLKGLPPYKERRHPVKRTHVRHLFAGVVEHRCDAVR